MKSFLDVIENIEQTISFQDFGNFTFLFLNKNETNKYVENVFSHYLNTTKISISDFIEQYKIDKLKTFSDDKTPKIILIDSNNVNSEHICDLDSVHLNQAQFKNIFFLFVAVENKKTYLKEMKHWDKRSVTSFHDIDDEIIRRGNYIQLNENVPSNDHKTSKNKI